MRGDKSWASHGTPGGANATRNGSHHKVIVHTPTRILLSDDRRRARGRRGLRISGVQLRPYFTGGLLNIATDDRRMKGIAEDAAAEEQQLAHLDAGRVDDRATDDLYGGGVERNRCVHRSAGRHCGAR